MEALNDALLVYMLDSAAPVYGRVKVQKTPFLVQLALRKIGRVASTFGFRRHHNGPFSQDVWDSLDRVTEYGFLREDYGLTDRGLLLVDLIHSLGEVPGNEDAFAEMATVLRHCRTHTGQELMNEVYEIELEPDSMPGERHRIRDIPSRRLILAGGETDLIVPPAVKSVLRAEMAMTEEQLAEATERAEEINREAAERLLVAIPSGLPS